MSFFRRKLIACNHSPKKENLAVVREAIIDVDELTTRNSLPCGLSARLEKGKKYYFIFDLEGEATKVGTSTRNQILSKWPNNYLSPQNWGVFYYGSDPKKFTYHYDIHATANKDADGSVKNILQYDISGMKGYIRVYNLEVYEE